MNLPFCRPHICTARSIATCHPTVHALSPDIAPAPTHAGRNRPSWAPILRPPPLTENIYLYYYIIQEFCRFLRALLHSRASIPGLPARVCVYIKIQGSQQK
jgi:hypothetical protein